MIRLTLAVGILALLVTPRVFAADSQPVSQTVKIVNVGTGKIMGVQDDSEEDSTPACLAKDESLDARRWTIEKDGSFLKITNRKSGKALDVSGDSMEEDGAIIIWPAKSSEDGNDNQRWSWDGDGKERRLKSKSSGLVLDVSTDGSLVQRHADPKSKSQLWRVAEPVFVKLVNVDNGKVLGIDGNSDDDEARAMLVKDDTSSADKNHARQWKIDTVGTFLKLTNRKSGKVLDVSGFSTDEGGVIIQYGDKPDGDPDGNDNQRWSWDGNGAERRLRSKSSGLVIDVDNDGSIVQRSGNGKAKTQLWRVVEAAE
jgi:Ricin-type beta-trefoil lectin domain-like